MPEGHTLHRLARLHQRRYAKYPVRVSSPQGRFAASASKVDGLMLRRADAYGKHLFHVYGPDAIVHIHLGLYGTFTEAELPVTPPVGQVRMRLTGRTHWTDLRGPSACELISDEERVALLARLGPDPLVKDADSERGWQRLARSRTAIAALLLDQRVVAGVGNVYRAEVLFRQGISPSRQGRDLDQAEWGALWADLVELMRAGVHSGRIDTVRPEHAPELTGRAPRSDPHGGEVYVYRRAGMPCLVCATPVAGTDLAGRKLYWCPTCQPDG
jgi:endonuclease-8